jgi:hypothetical protein
MHCNYWKTPTEIQWEIISFILSSLTPFFIYTSIIKNKLTKFYENLIGEEQNGFCKGQSCGDGYFSLKLIIEKHRQFNIKTHLAFIDFKKAFDKVNRNKLMKILKANNIPNQLIVAIYNIYKNNLIAIKMESEL